MESSITALLGWTEGLQLMKKARNIVYDPAEWVRCSALAMIQPFCLSVDVALIRVCYNVWFKQQERNERL